MGDEGAIILLKAFEPGRFRTLVGLEDQSRLYLNNLSIRLVY